jgi:hypothetical protein
MDDGAVKSELTRYLFDVWESIISGVVALCYRLPPQDGPGATNACR